jgi:prophage antirepressor-like protein
VKGGEVQMTNELMIFENNDFGLVRSMWIDDVPWFVGKDVATALGYTKTENAISNHVYKDDTLKRGVTDSLGRTQQMTIINESGLYALIFGSKLPSAVSFKRWVTSEVLPTLRKTGQFSMKTPSREECMHAAEIIAKCPNKRLPVVLSVLGKAGFDFNSTTEPVIIDEPDTELIDLMNQFTLVQLTEILGLPRTSLYYYMKGQVQPPKNRKKFIINTLKQQRM